MRPGAAGFLHRYCAAPLRDHDRIVDDNTDCEDEAKHAGQVDRKAQGRKQSERSNNRNRNREQRNQSRPPVLQEDKNDYNDQPDRFQQSQQDFVNSGVDENSRVIGNDVIHSGRKIFLGLPHELADPVHGCHSIGAGRKIHDEVAGGDAVDAAEAAVVLGSQLHVSDITNTQPRMRPRVRERRTTSSNWLDLQAGPER